jgi:hypothetical protein
VVRGVREEGKGRGWIEVLRMRVGGRVRKVGGGR